MINAVSKINNLVFGSSLVVLIWIGSSVSALASEVSPCSETLLDHTLEWTILPFHEGMETRNCHSQLSDALKAKSGSNEVLSHAVYHQILAGESFQNIPMWPDKHEDWVDHYQGYNYAAIFKPALDAAKEAWDKGYEQGGARHDFVVGWTRAVLDDDFRINEYRNRTGGFTGLKSYMTLPGLIFILLVLMEGLIDRLGWLKGYRFFYRDKYR